MLFLSRLLIVPVHVCCCLGFPAVQSLKLSDFRFQTPPYFDKLPYLSQDVAEHAGICRIGLAQSSFSPISGVCWDGLLSNIPKGHNRSISRHVHHLRAVKKGCDPLLQMSVLLCLSSRAAENPLRHPPCS